MSYANFIPTVWAEEIQRDLERKCVFVEDCNTSYEGIVKQKGESVKILGVGKPTIKSVLKTDRNNNIDDPEEIEDTSVIMYINQIRYFNYMVGDIDKAQAVGNVMEKLSQETTEGLANEKDKYIAALAADKSVPKLFTEAQKVIAGTTGTDGMNVLHVLDNALEKLYENDVSATSDIVVTVSPRFYTLFKQAYISKDTDNSDFMKNGKVARYGNVTVKMSNNVYRTDSGATDNIMIRTKRAVAFACPHVQTEAYRPEKKFADAVKGFILFDGKVVRPKEIFNVNVKYS